MTHAVRAVRTTGLFALHHLTVLAGILAFPLVFLGRQAGLRLPMGAVVARIHEAYDAATDTGDADGPAGETER